MINPPGKNPTKREISVCSEFGAKNAFRLMPEGRIDERPLSEPGSDDLDVVVFQAGQNLDFAETFDQLPPRLWASARAGRGKVVFDASSEGRMHDPRTTDQLHALLRRAGVPLEQGVYLTQNRPYAQDYAVSCDSNGIAERMKIVVYDYWIRRVLSEYEGRGEKIFRRRLANFHRRKVSRSRRFVSLNFTPRSSKLIFLTRIMKEGLWDLGFISFGGFEQMARRKGKSFDRIKLAFLQAPGFEDQTPALAPFLDDLAARGRILLGDVPNRRAYDEIMRAATLPEYDETWFSAVTETEMVDRPCRITEKVLKPLLNFHPLIVFGNPASLKLISDLGFVTFPELVDERYDDEFLAPRRFELAFEQLRRLCRMDEHELARLSASVDEKLKFNAEWGLTKLPQKFATEIDEAFLTEVLEPAGANSWVQARAAAPARL